MGEKKQGAMFAHTLPMALLLGNDTGTKLFVKMTTALTILSRVRRANGVLETLH